MIVDSSALIALTLREPTADALERRLLSSDVVGIGDDFRQTDLALVPV